MQGTGTPVVKDLVLIGGGHSHVAVLKSFGMKPVEGVRLTLISRDVHTPYSGMLPGLIAGHYGFDDAHIDLRPLTQFAGARLFHDEAVGIDLAEKRVLCRDRPPVRYDLLSINIGSTPRMAEFPGAAGTVVPVKPINTFIDRWEALAERVMRHDGPLAIGVVGAGAGGVELLLAVQYRLHRIFHRHGFKFGRLSFHIVTDTDELLPSHNPKVRQIFARVMRKRGVEVHTGRKVVAVEPGAVVAADGTRIALDEILWVTPAGAAPWLAETGLDLDERGFVKVRDTLESTSHPGVFAAGDVAGVAAHPRPKAGVFAVRQGPPLADNLRRALHGRPLQPFAPQKDFLSIVSTGDKHAVASRGNRVVEGDWVWRAKDWIDRRWMRKYTDLPEMPSEEATTVAPGLADADAMREISAIAMRCGGCGAKVGSSVLDRALASLQPVPRGDVLVGLDAPDDAAVVAVPAGKVMVHSVDFFRAFVDDPYVFGQVAANHSLGDIFAMGAEPQTALAVVSVPYGLEAKVEETLFQLMSGALAVLNAADTALVGGHTSEGAELSLGFAVNGLIDREAVLRKGGMQPGDRLILTKPLGTGTLFAADMRGKAKGRWIDAALASMVQSSRDAAHCLRRFGVHACTDVTGFGLLGHLVEMTRPSGVDVELDLAALPVIDGAEATLAAGVFSSLQPANVRLRRAIRDQAEVSGHPRYPLLFDPQTAGGLLASVPAEAAEPCLAELRALGYGQAAIVGTVREGSDALEPIVLLV